MNELKAKIDKVYEDIQYLKMPHTPLNTKLMAECFILLEEIYNSLPDDVSKTDLDKDSKEPEEAEKAEKADEA